MAEPEPTPEQRTAAMTLALMEYTAQMAPLWEMLSGLRRTLIDAGFTPDQAGDLVREFGVGFIRKVMATPTPRDLGEDVGTWFARRLGRGPDGGVGR